MKTKKLVISVILSFCVVPVSQILSQLIASGCLMIGLPEFICNIMVGILYIFGAYGLLKLLCKKYIKEDLSNYNMPRFKIDMKWLIVAFALPVLVSAVYLLFVDGVYVGSDMGITEKLSVISLGVFFTGFGAGFVEEMVFRGIMMTAIEKKFNRKIAIIVPSLLFGAVHIIGMNFNLLSCILVLAAGTMVGIMFSLIAATTNSVWNSAIVHAVWNMIIIGGGLVIDTEARQNALCTYVLNNKSFVLTGGEFGIESSVIAVVGYCVVSLIIIHSNKKKI